MTNASGLQPINCNVLVMADVVEEKTKGGLLLPEDVTEKDQHAQTRGTIVALSADAFLDEMGGYTWDCAPGRRVTFGRYAGKKTRGDDGQDYLLMKDIDVTGFEV